MWKTRKLTPKNPGPEPRWAVPFPWLGRMTMTGTLKVALLLETSRVCGRDMAGR